MMATGYTMMTKLLWPSFFVAVAVMVCGLQFLWPSLSWFVAVNFRGHRSCGRHCHGLWLSIFVAIVVVAITLMVCGRQFLWPS